MKKLGIIAMMLMGIFLVGCESTEEGIMLHDKSIECKNLYTNKIFGSCNKNEMFPDLHCIENWTSEHYSTPSTYEYNIFYSKKNHSCLLSFKREYINCYFGQTCTEDSHIDKSMDRIELEYEITNLDDNKDIYREHRLERENGYYIGYQKNTTIKSPFEFINKEREKFDKVLKDNE